MRIFYLYFASLCIILTVWVAYARYVSLADRTARIMIGYFHDNVVYLSVRPSVTLCIVAKQYILQQKCLDKWIGSAHGNTILQLTTPTPTLFPKLPTRINFEILLIN